jgi:hypothetical protein
MKTIGEYNIAIIDLESLINKSRRELISIKSERDQCIFDGDVFPNTNIRRCTYIPMDLDGRNRDEVSDLLKDHLDLFWVRWANETHYTDLDLLRFPKPPKWATHAFWNHHETE